MDQKRLKVVVRQTLSLDSTIDQALHFFQAGNPILQWRVRIEKMIQPAMTLGIFFRISDI